MDLFNDFKLAIQKDLDSVGVTYPKNATAEDVLILFYTYKRKRILPRPRKAFQSSEFKVALNSCSSPEKQAMADIIAKFENGDDVNGHLSKASVNPSRTDGLLYDWDIYHIHVSNTKKDPSQKFFDRSGPVALVKVTSTDAYFIDIRDHGKNPLLWTQQDILGIVSKNWPALHAPVVIDALDTAFQPTDAQLKQLRGDPKTGRGAVNVVIKSGGKIIAPPGGGMATDGTPVAVSEVVDKTLYILKALENYLLAHGNPIKAELEQKLKVPVSSQDFELARHDKFWVIREISSQQIIEIANTLSFLAQLPAVI